MTKNVECQSTEKLVEIRTSLGNIVVKLYNETPAHRDNFIKLATDTFYNGCLFHRIIKGFMIQGGDPNSKTAKAGDMLGSGDPGYTLPAEFNPNFFHKKGALAAARKGDMVNPEKRSSGSQFYIVQGEVYTPEVLRKMELHYKKTFSVKQIEAYSTVGGTPHLDGDYTVFGEVIEGFDVIDKIATVKTDRNSRPLEDIAFSVVVKE